MKAWKLILFLTGILFLAQLHATTLNITYLERSCAAQINIPNQSSTGNTGSYSVSFQTNDVFTRVFGTIDSSISLSGNVLSISGIGHYNDSGTVAENFNAWSFIQLTFNIDAPYYYSIIINSTQVDSPPLGSSPYTYYFDNNTYLEGGTDFFENITSSGTLQAGTYSLSCGGDFDDFVEIRPNPFSDTASWQVILTVSPSTILSTTINGKIADSCSGVPISGATVQIGPLTLLTDSNGNYSQSNLPPAVYTVIASATNYSAVTNTVTTSSIQTNVTQNFSLSSLGRLDYFGVGVSWLNVVIPPNMNGLRGDVDATDLYDALQANLSSTFSQSSTVVALNANATTTANMNSVLVAFTQFASNVCPGDTVVLYVATHAGPHTVNGVTDIQLALGSDFGSQFPMTASHLESMLSQLPPATRCVVILESCDAGGIANELANANPNIAILAASPVSGNASFISDGTGVFTDSLVELLFAGIFDLNTITSDIDADNFKGQPLYANLIGQTLSLEGSGSNIFTGLQPQLWKGKGFAGTLASNTVTTLQPPPTVTQPRITNGQFQMTLTNLPTNGSIAIELSTNLTSWLQVSFQPATGSNQLFSFGMSNYPCAYFRTKVVP